MNIGTKVMLTADAGDLRTGDRGVVTDVREDGSTMISFTIERSYRMRADGTLVPQAQEPAGLLVELGPGRGSVGWPTGDANRFKKPGPTIPVIERFWRSERLDELVEMSRDGSRRQAKVERTIFVATCRAIRKGFLLQRAGHGEVRWPDILNGLKDDHNASGGKNFLYQFDCAKRFLVAKHILKRVGKAVLRLDAVQPHAFELACDRAWKDLPTRLH